MTRRPSTTAVELFASLASTAQPVRAAVFAELRLGRSVSVEDIAAATGSGPHEVAEVLDALQGIGIAQTDDTGAIVAAGMIRR